MTTTPKDLEIAAIAISMAAGCIPCTRYHLREAKTQGASLVEMMHVMTVSNSASAPDRLPGVASREVWKLFQGDAPLTERCLHQALLADIGISVCQNNVSRLKLAVAAAQTAKLSDDQIVEIVGLAHRIKEKAASHLSSVIGALDADPSMAEKAAKLCS